MKYEKYKLECGHNGNIIWRSSDGKIVGVRGTRSSCGVCTVAFHLKNAVKDTLNG